MNLQEIKDAIERGQRVYFNGLHCEALLRGGKYLIEHQALRRSIDLTWSDEVTLNGCEEDFFRSGHWLAQYSRPDGTRHFVADATQGHAGRRMCGELNSDDRETFQSLWDAAGCGGFRFCSMDAPGDTIIELIQAP